MNDKELSQIKAKSQKLLDDFDELMPSIIAVATTRDTKQTNAAVSGVRMAAVGLKRAIQGMLGTYQPANKSKSDNKK